MQAHKAHLTETLNNDPVERAIDLLYATVGAPDGWRAFLEVCTGLLNATGAQIAHHDMVNMELSFSYVYGYDWTPEHYQRYEALMPMDPRLPHFTANPFRPVHCRMFLSDAELHASPVYQDVLSVGGVEYSMGVNFSENERSLSYFLVLRSAEQPRFTDAECAALEPLLPHLNRVLRLHRDIGLIETKRDLALDSLDSIALGIFVLAADAGVEMANLSAKKMVAEKDGLEITEKKLMSVGVDHDLISPALAQMASSSQEHTAQIVLQLPRPSGADPYLCMMSELSGGRAAKHASEPGQKHYLLIVRDAAMANETRAEVLQRLHGLTPAQARLADLLAEGKSLAEIAMNMTITEASARQYCKICFEKMGVNRQSELVRKVLLLPSSTGVLPRQPRTFTDSGGAKKIDTSSIGG